MSGSHIDIVCDLIARFFNGHNPDLATEFFASQLEWNGGSVGSVIGAENYAAVMRQFFEALPDVHAAEQEVLGDGDKQGFLVYPKSFKSTPFLARIGTFQNLLRKREMA